MAKEGRGKPQPTLENLADIEACAPDPPFLAADSWLSGRREIWMNDWQQPSGPCKHRPSRHGRVDNRVHFAFSRSAARTET
jgi:hypothetical protein